MKAKWRGLSLTVSALLLFLPAAARAEGAPNGGTTVQITVGGNLNKVEFQVRDKKGTAVKGAAVDIRKEKGDWLSCGTTDSGGRKNLELPVSIQYYRVNKTGYLTKTGKFTVIKDTSKTIVKVVLEKKSKPVSDSSKPSGGSQSNGNNAGGSGSRPGGSGNSGAGQGSSGNSGAGQENSGNVGVGQDSSGGASQTGSGTVMDNSGRDKKASDSSGKDKKDKGKKEDKAEQDRSAYSGYVDMALNVVRPDGTPAAGLEVELHSKIQTGTIDNKGFILFPEVEVADHVVYIKNNEGITLARKAFTISRSSATGLEADNVVTVGAMAAQITLNVEFDEAGGVSLISARDGITDISGRPVTNENAKKTAPEKSSLFLKIIRQPQLWLALILMIVMLISLHLLGKCGGNREKEAKDYEYKTAWKE